MKNEIDYAAYIFDFDLTLANTAGAIVMCANCALEQMNRPPCSVEDIKKTIGYPLGDMFETLTGVRDDKLREEFVTRYMQKADDVMTEKTELFPDTIRTLEYLKSGNKKTGIVTTKRRSRIDEVLQKDRIEHLIDIVVGGDEVKKMKPDPSGLLFAIRELKVPKEKVLYIGDSVVDAETAKNAGVDFTAVTTGATPRETFLPLPHKRIISSLTELTE